MLRTIDNLFKNCDFIQLLSSAGLAGMGTIKKYLSGGDAKEGIILYKKLFEALMRTKIEYIEKTRISDVLNDDHINSLIDIMIEKITSDTVESVLRSINMGFIPVLNGDVANLLQIYLDMVNTMLNFIHFLRTRIGKAI